MLDATHLSRVLAATSYIQSTTRGTICRSVYRTPSWKYGTASVPQECIPISSANCGEHTLLKLFYQHICPYLSCNQTFRQVVICFVFRTSQARASKNYSLNPSSVHPSKNILVFDAPQAINQSEIRIRRTESLSKPIHFNTKVLGKIYYKVHAITFTI